MQINGHIKFRHLGPKDFKLRLVSVYSGVFVLDIAVTIDKRTFEAKLLHTALEFVRGGFGVLQGHRRKPRITIGMAGDDIFGKKVIGPFCVLDGDVGIGFGLNSRCKK